MHHYSICSNKVKAYIIISLALFELPLKYLSKLSPDRGEGQAMSANHGGGVGNMSPEPGSNEEKRFKKPH